jgi:hypothetical protein
MILLLILNQKNSKNVLFLQQNGHLKPKIDCKDNGKWKLQTCFSWNYDFAFTNLLKMQQNYSVFHRFRQAKFDYNLAALV